MFCRLADTICAAKNGDHFFLVGAYHVHGIMGGEAWEEVQTGKFKMLDFTLQ